MKQYDACVVCGEAAENGICLGCGLLEEDCECPPREEPHRPDE